MKLKNKILSMLTALAVLFGMLCSPVLTFADTFTDTDAGVPQNIPVTATVESSYKIELPAVVDLTVENLGRKTREQAEQYAEEEYGSSKNDLYRYYREQNPDVIWTGTDEQKAEAWEWFVVQCMSDRIYLYEKSKINKVKVSDCNLPKNKRIRIGIDNPDNSSNTNEGLITIKGKNSAHEISIRGSFGDWGGARKKEAFVSPHITSAGYYNVFDAASDPEIPLWFNILNGGHSYPADEYTGNLEISWGITDNPDF